MKKLANEFLHRFDLQLSRVSEQSEVDEVATKNNLWLKKMQIKTIFDIGANSGQFAAEIHQLFPEAMLYSFEPLPDCYSQLMANFQGTPNFKAFNLALGNETGYTEIYRSDYSLSSSLLPMAQTHKEAFPFTAGSTSEKIEIARLDDVASHLNIQKPFLIKLDVQGFEDAVIQGGRNTISEADVVITELSLEELYVGQKLFDDIYNLLVTLGFKYRGNYDQLCDPNDGRMLQMDGIFIKA